jgi:hypothetical protein
LCLKKQKLTQDPIYLKDLGDENKKPAKNVFKKEKRVAGVECIQFVQYGLQWQVLESITSQGPTESGNFLDQ